MSNRRAREQRMLCKEDISAGEAACPIPVVNLVDDTDFDDEQFMYIEECVNDKEQMPAKLHGCSCEAVCLPESCECIRESSIQLTDDHRIDLREGPPDFYATILHECDARTCKGCRGKCQWRLRPERFNLAVEIYKTPNAGWAVRSRQFIETGTFVAEFVGEINTERRMAQRPYDYAYNVPIRSGKSSANFFIDPHRYGNISRFLNHSCFENLHPFLFLSKHRNEDRVSMGLYASRDIAPGDELTIDYGTDWWRDKIGEAWARDERFYCYCSWVNCINPAPGKPQMDEEDAIEEAERLIAKNFHALVAWKDAGRERQRKGRKRRVSEEDEEDEEEAEDEEGEQFKPEMGDDQEEEEDELLAEESEGTSVEEMQGTEEG